MAERLQAGPARAEGPCEEGLSAGSWNGRGAAGLAGEQPVDLTEALGGGPQVGLLHVSRRDEV